MPKNSVTDKEIKEEIEKFNNSFIKAVNDVLDLAKEGLKSETFTPLISFIKITEKGIDVETEDASFHNNQHKIASLQYFKAKFDSEKDILGVIMAQDVKILKPTSELINHVKKTLGEDQISRIVQREEGEALLVVSKTKYDYQNSLLTEYIKTDESIVFDETKSSKDTHGFF